MEYTNLAQPWQEQANRSERLPMKSNAKWSFIHHPKNWEIVELETIGADTKTKKGKAPTSQFLFLPVLKNLNESPGVNCVRGDNLGNTDSTFAKSKLMAQGWQIIDPKVIDYLRVYPASKGNYHTSKFQKLENLGGEVLKSFDQKGFNAWRKELMAKGHVKMPHPQILKRMIAAERRKIERHSRNQHIPEIAHKMQAYAEKIQQMNSAIAKITELGKLAYV